jgi:hypothetical protein
LRCVSAANADVDSEAALREFAADAARLAASYAAMREVVEATSMPEMALYAARAK